MKVPKWIFLIVFGYLFLNSHAQVLLNPQVDSIPMRDGKMLAADIYLPDTTGQYPVILIQTPYNRLYYRIGLPLVGRDLKTSQYAFVIVDWRCFYGSKKACKLLPDRGKDGYDVIDWITNQTWSNGKVGTWGPSALGKVQYLTAREQHPALKCAVPIVAAPQFTYKEYYPGGVYRPEYVEQLDALGYGMSTILQAHPYYDNWWKIAEKASWYPDKIKIPLLLIGGWFDHNVGEMFDFFDTLVKSSDPVVRDQHKFLVGPWTHTTVGLERVGDLDFPEAKGVSDSFTRLFFDYYLLGAKNGWPLTRTFIVSKVVWQGGNGYKAFFNQYTYGEYTNNQGFFDSLFINTEPFPVNSYGIVGNPRFPSPTIGGPTLRTDLKQGPVDISGDIHHDSSHFFFYYYPDHPSTVMIEGRSTLHLGVSVDRPDCDLAARLAVYNPQSNRIYILADGIMRSRFRNGFSKNDETLVTPYQKYELEIEFPPLHTEIVAPATLVIIISSSNYPRFDVNLNNGKEMYTAGDTNVAHIKLRFDGSSYFRYTGMEIIEGIKEQSGNKVVIYPNPACDYLYFQSVKNTTHNKIEIIDINGRLVKSMYPVVNSINIQDLDPGLYLFRMKNNEGVMSGRFIKM